MAESANAHDADDEAEGVAYRAVHPEHWSGRVTSGAIPKGQPKFSVALQRLLAEKPAEADNCICRLVDQGQFAGSPAHAISRINIEAARSLSFHTRWERDEAAGEHEAHAHVRYASGKITKSAARAMAKLMTKDMLRKPESSPE